MPCQVCGARGAGSAAGQGVFLAMRPHEVYMLVSVVAYPTPTPPNPLYFPTISLTGHGCEETAVYRDYTSWALGQIWFNSRGGR